MDLPLDFDRQDKKPRPVLQGSAKDPYQDTDADQQDYR
jgi:hypothetical protein